MFYSFSPNVESDLQGRAESSHLRLREGGQGRPNFRQFLTIDRKTIDPLFNPLFKSGQISEERTVSCTWGALRPKPSIGFGPVQGPFWENFQGPGDRWASPPLPLGLLIKCLCSFLAPILKNIFLPPRVSCFM